MGEKDADREIGELSAKVETLQREVALLREKQHRNSNVIQALVNDMATFKILKLGDRIQLLEYWRQWILGASAAVGIIFGAIGSYIMKKL